MSICCSFHHLNSAVCEDIYKITKNSSIYMYIMSVYIIRSGRKVTTGSFLNRILFSRLKFRIGSEFESGLLCLLQAEEMAQHHLLYVSPNSSMLIPPYICLQCIHGLC